MSRRPYPPLPRPRPRDRFGRAPAHDSAYPSGVLMLDEEIVDVELVRAAFENAHRGPGPPRRVRIQRIEVSRPEPLFVVRPLSERIAGWFRRRFGRASS